MLARSVIAALPVLLALGGAANAKCGTKALDGQWLAQVYDVGTVLNLVIESGNVTSGGSPLGTISQTTGCKVAFAISGETARGWSDFVVSTSSRKPRVIDLGADGDMILMIRKP